MASPGKTDTQRAFRHAVARIVEPVLRAHGYVHVPEEDARPTLSVCVRFERPPRWAEVLLDVREGDVEVRAGELPSDDFLSAMGHLLTDHLRKKGVDVTSIVRAEGDSMEGRLRAHAKLLAIYLGEPGS